MYIVKPVMVATSIVALILCGSAAAEEVLTKKTIVNETLVKEVLIVPTAEAYLSMTPEARYQLRLKVRKMPADVKAVYYPKLRAMLDSLPPKQLSALVKEKYYFDGKYGTSEPK